MQGALQGIAGFLMHIRMQPHAMDLSIVCAIVRNQVNRHCTVSLLQQARIAASSAPMDTSDDELDPFSLEEAQPCSPAQAAGSMHAAPDAYSERPCVPVDSASAAPPSRSAALRPFGMLGPLHFPETASEGPRPDAAVSRGAYDGPLPEAHVLGGLGTSTRSFRPASLAGHTGLLTSSHPYSTTGPHSGSMSQRGRPPDTGPPHMQARSGSALHGAGPLLQPFGLSAPAQPAPVQPGQASSEAPHHATKLGCTPGDTLDAELEAFDCTQLPATDSSMDPLLEELLSWQ